MWKKSIVLAVAALYMYYTRDTFDPASISGKNVLVTGASKGIGKALALQYARMGANVMITARTEKALKEVVAECTKVGLKGAKFGYVVADMLNYKTDYMKVVDATLKRLKTLDQVVLNHAILPGKDQKFQRWAASDDELSFFEKSMQTNFNSYVYLAGELIPHLRRSHGQLCVISSMAGKMPTYGAAPYSASKYAMDGFFSTLRLEMKFDKVPVPITVCNLGMIGTEDMDKHVQSFIQAMDFDEEKIRPYLQAANIDDTAFKIIQATTRGDRELYYPALLGIDTWWIPIIRHIHPNIIELDIEQFKKQI